jgi:hypothetical protein
MIHPTPSPQIRTSNSLTASPYLEGWIITGSSSGRPVERVALGAALPLRAPMDTASNRDARPCHRTSMSRSAGREPAHVGHHAVRIGTIREHPHTHHAAGAELELDTHACVSPRRLELTRNTCSGSPPRWPAPAPAAMASRRARSRERACRHRSPHVRAWGRRPAIEPWHHAQRRGAGSWAVSGAGEIIMAGVPRALAAGAPAGTRA